MRDIRKLVIGIAAAANVGCIGSVNPVISDSAARFEPQLLGTWIDSASKERAVITRGGPRGYVIQYTDDQGQPVSLDGTLGQSRGRYILDVRPAAAALGPYKDLVLRLHIPVILDSLGSRIHAATLEPDSLDHYLRSQPNAVPHGRTTDGVLLTGSSPELERFFAVYLQRAGVLSRPSTWVRRSP